MFAIFNRRIGGALMVSAIVSLAIPAIAQSVPPNPLPDATLRSTPQNRSLGLVGRTPVFRALPQLAIGVRPMHPLKYRTCTSCITVRWKVSSP